MQIEITRYHEQHIQSFAYVFDYLAVLTVVHVKNGTRIISFRRDEREVYHEWLAHDFK